MFCSSASLFSCFFTILKKFSIGLMSGLLSGIENIRAPISKIAFLAFKEIWLGCPSYRNNFPCGLLLFSKTFSKCSLRKSTKNCPVNCSSYCSQRTAPYHRQWLQTLSQFTSRAFFFSFCGAFQSQTLWFFMPCYCSSWSVLVTWIRFIGPWGSIKIESNLIIPKVPWKNTFYFSSKTQSCSGIMPWHQTFISWL